MTAPARKQTDVPFRLSPLLGSRGKSFLTGTLLTLFLANPLTIPVQAGYDLHDNTGYHNRRGEFLLTQQQFGAALDEFRAAIALSPGITMEAAFQNNLGIAYLGMAESAEKVQPQNRDRIRSTYYPLAIDAFMKACQLAPTYALYRHNLIRAHAMAGQLQEYEQELLTMVVETPNNAESWFLLGLLYRRQNDAKRARPCFINFIKLQPGSEMARAARQFLKEHPEEEDRAEGKENEHGGHKSEDHKEGEAKEGTGRTEGGADEEAQDHSKTAQDAQKANEHGETKETGKKPPSQFDNTKAGNAHSETKRSEPNAVNAKSEGKSKSSVTSIQQPSHNRPQRTSASEDELPLSVKTPKAPLTLPQAKANPPGNKAPEIKQDPAPVLDSTEDIPELRGAIPKHPADKGIKPFTAGNRKPKNLIPLDPAPYGKARPR